MIDVLLSTYKNNGLRDTIFMLSVALTVNINLWIGTFQQAIQWFINVCQTFDWVICQSQHQHKNNQGSSRTRGGPFFV